MAKSLICRVNEPLLWLLTRGRPQGPTPRSRPPPSPRADRLSPARLRALSLSPSCRINTPVLVPPPPASPQSCFPAPGAPWPATLFPGTVFVSPPLAASLSSHIRPSARSSLRPALALQAAGGGGCALRPESWGLRARCPESAEWTRSWGHTPPAVCPQPPRPSQGGCPDTWRGSHRTGWESGDPSGALAVAPFPRVPFLWIKGHRAWAARCGKSTGPSSYPKPASPPAPKG